MQVPEPLRALLSENLNVDYDIAIFISSLQIESIKLFSKQPVEHMFENRKEAI